MRFQPTTARQQKKKTKKKNWQRKLKTEWGGMAVQKKINVCFGIKMISRKFFFFIRSLSLSRNTRSARNDFLLCAVWLWCVYFTLFAFGKLLIYRNVRDVRDVAGAKKRKFFRIPGRDVGISSCRAAMIQVKLICAIWIGWSAFFFPVPLTP